MSAIKEIKSWSKNIEKCQNDILSYFEDDLIAVDLLNNDGEGIVLDTCLSNDTLGDCNIEVYQVYFDLSADTNFGKIDLTKVITDEDDWYTLYDCVTDTLA